MRELAGVVGVLGVLGVIILVLVLLEVLWVEQGLGQGRVEAPSDSNRLDTAIADALQSGNAYRVGEGRYLVKLGKIHYADDRNAYTEGEPGSIDEHVQDMALVQLVQKHCDAPLERILLSEGLTDEDTLLKAHAARLTTRCVSRSDMAGTFAKSAVGLSRPAGLSSTRRTWLG